MMFWLERALIHLESEMEEELSRLWNCT